LQHHFELSIKTDKISQRSEIVALLKAEINRFTDSFEVDVLNMECIEAYFYMIFASKSTINTRKMI
jgi:hypothetical protein